MIHQRSSGLKGAAASLYIFINFLRLIQSAINTVSECRHTVCPIRWIFTAWTRRIAIFKELVRKLIIQLNLYPSFLLVLIRNII